MPISQNTDLYGIDLYNAYLPRASFENAILVTANFAGADLEYANFRGANLFCTNLAGASLYGIRGWGLIRSLDRANLYRVRNYPEGFIELAKKMGAVSMTEKDWNEQMLPMCRDRNPHLP